MSNVDNSSKIIVFRQPKNCQLDTDLTTFLQEKGFDSIRDYDYSIAKEISRDPKCSLNRLYYKKAQNYLDVALEASIHYLRTGSGYYLSKTKESFIVTAYSLNEVVEAIDNKHPELIEKLAIKNFNPDSFINQIKEKLEEANKQRQQAKLIKVKSKLREM